MHMRGIIVMGMTGKLYDISAVVAAEMLGVTPNTLRLWARMGKVPARQNLSGRWLFNIDDLREAGNIAVNVVSSDDG